MPYNSDLNIYKSFLPSWIQVADFNTAIIINTNNNSVAVDLTGCCSKFEIYEQVVGWNEKAMLTTV